MAKMTLKELFKTWGYVAANSFGGPAGQIAVIHKVVVEDKKIISEEKFLHALNFCMLLPGPEAQQLATYMGWLMAKWKGGFIAGSLFILPGFLSILALSYLYAFYKDITLVEGLFYGIKPAIVAIVLGALYKISKKSLTNSFYWILAFFAFIALFFMNIPFPVVVVTSGLFGMINGYVIKDKQYLELELKSPPKVFDTLKTFMIWFVVWIIPIFFILIIFGEDSTFHTINIFFSKMSLVTFGGAYAALSYVAQQAVDVYGWLRGTEMLDGLALAETTPGPLIQVVQYVGFMASYRFPGVMTPGLSAFIGSCLTTWMTFAPCFLFIFTLAPYVEYIRGKKIFTYALKAITAAVVGVIFNLSLWFVLNTLFSQSVSVDFSVFNFDYPKLNTIDLFASIICVIALIMQFKLKKGILSILSVCALTGIVYKYLV